MLSPKEIDALFAARDECAEAGCLNGLEAVRLSRPYHSVALTAGVDHLLKLRLEDRRTRLVDGVDNVLVQVDGDDIESLCGEAGRHGGAQLSEADDGQTYVLRHDEATGDWELAALTRGAG